MPEQLLWAADPGQQFWRADERARREWPQRPRRRSALILAGGGCGAEPGGGWWWHEQLLVLVGCGAGGDADAAGEGVAGGDVGEVDVEEPALQVAQGPYATSEVYLYIHKNLAFFTMTPLFSFPLRVRYAS
ncbi:hypothetical protein Vafri_13056 [Volvox africanus]|uniref:Uncharacterized protein n=1 Tax=Volvox africanus TaxID=51714 RepID=A0A8J4BFV5_9CHLO|nr:hypothetical protein Vafri_13056 [Volvox africanus]